MATPQFAMYCHGVGDNRWIPSEWALGGAFAAGLTTRIRLGYTYISSNYNPGDKIVIVGFSRGAYTARALAGLIASQGLLCRNLSEGHGSLSWAAAAWMEYRQDHIFKNKRDLWQDFIEKTAQIHARLTREPQPDDFVAVDSIEAVAVWDTVGAMGIPRYSRTDRIDEFEFASLILHSKVKLGLHAVSLDERRIDFEPTLWEPADNVRQELFADGHKDVGGGYCEHQLSDVPLKWVVDSLVDRNVPVTFNIPSTGTGYDPNALGMGHREWTHGLGDLPAHPYRLFRHSRVTRRLPLHVQMGRAATLLAISDLRDSMRHSFRKI